MKPVDSLVEELIQSGMFPSEARVEAARRLGQQPTLEDIYKASTCRLLRYNLKEAIAEAPFVIVIDIKGNDDVLITRYEKEKK